MVLWAITLYSRRARKQTGCYCHQVMWGTAWLNIIVLIKITNELFKKMYC